MTDALNQNTQAMNRVADALEAKAKKEEEAKNDVNKKLSAAMGAVGKNTATILGLSQGLLSITGIFSKAAQQNSQIVRQLSQFTVTSRQTSKSLIDTLDTGYSTLQEGLETQGELIGAGMGDISKQNKSSFLAMKALGMNLAQTIAITRFNSDAVGLSTEASVDLARSIQEAAIANAESTEDLANAISSMREALIKTTVELGPEMSQKVQNVVLRMTQNNSELAGAASQFVTSFLAGEDGFMKAARLGVGFTGTETEEQLVSKIEILSQRIAQMGMGAQGFGAGIVFQRFEDLFGISRENFLVAEKMGTSIDELRRGNVVTAAEQIKRMDASRQIEIAMFKAQGLAIDAQQVMSKNLNGLGAWMPAALGLLTTIAAMTTMAAMNPLGGVSKGMQAMGPRAGGAALALGVIPFAVQANEMFAGIENMDKGGPGPSAGSIGGTAGGIIGGVLGGVFGGPFGAGIGMGLGSTFGSLVGNIFEEEQTKHSDKMEEKLNEILGINEKEQKDTEEIRRIQEDQERRQRSLANPQLHILTSINDVLVNNLATLGRIERLNADANTTSEDIKHNTTPRRRGVSLGSITGSRF